MDPILEFQKEVASNIEALGAQPSLRELSIRWNSEVNALKYSYNFSWMGRPIIQLPQDLQAMQEIIWKVKPTLIIETGIAHGGSLIFYASMMHMMDISGQVLGIDTDIRPHNFREITRHPMYKRITMLEGSSIEKRIITKAYEFAAQHDAILVCLDSNHTHGHVLKELETYAPLVSVNSYCVVFDTGIEDMPTSDSLDRPWGPGNSPKTAVHTFLSKNRDFVIDKSIQNKLLITSAPDGYLNRIR